MPLGRRQFAACAAARLLGCALPFQAHSKAGETSRLEWDPSTLVLIRRGGGYGRMVRLPDRNILCSYEVAGKIYVAHSRDDGRTWEREKLAAEFAFGNAANPEMLVIGNGTILLSYNQRPRDGVHPFAIAISFSEDSGRAWCPGRIIYAAGTDSGTGCWEPAQIQLPSGEIQLFFANERPYPDTAEQEITLLRSFDNGKTWSEPKTVAFRAGHRDGMPVPLLLAGGEGVVIAIEDNGLAGNFKPTVIHTSVRENWAQGFAGGDSPRRWSALDAPLPRGVYCGAPYLRQFAGGATVLSVQSGEGRADETALRTSRMVVYLGDSHARRFTSASEPFRVPANASGLWNSLFIKSRSTVTAISGTTVGGVRGVWAIDGRLASRPEKNP